MNAKSPDSTSSLTQTPRNWPARVYRPEAAIAAHGSLLERLVPWLEQEDPLADAVIEDFGEDMSARWGGFERALAMGPAALNTHLSDPVRALLASVATPPFWVDFDRIDRAGALLFRTGPVGGIVLGARSLVYGYASPDGNKPLVMSGRLNQQPSRRLAETSRFVYEVCRPGGLRPGAEGFNITLRVRLMHARVRWLIRKGDQWNAEAWGQPINQHDMFATSLLFSQVWLDGGRKFGFAFSDQEAEDWLHLWRWCSVVMGVEPELLPTTEAESRPIVQLIRMTQRPPDENSRRLVRSLMQTAQDEGVVLEKLGWGFLRALIEPHLADGLGVPNTRLKWVVPGVRQGIRPIDRLARRSRRVNQWMMKQGENHWVEAIDTGARPEHLPFMPALRLWGRL